MGKLATHFEDSVQLGRPPRQADAVRNIHGKMIPDPFRPLEDLKASCTAAWIAGEEADYQDFVADGKPSQSPQKAEPAAKGVPVKLGNNYLFYYRGEGEAQTRVMISDTPEGHGRTLIDPLKIDPGGSTGVDAYPSPDGKYIAYRLRRKGLWESEVRVMEVDTGKDLNETFAPAGSITWDKDSKGFAYNFRDDPQHSQHITYRHRALDDYPGRDTPFYDKTTREGATARPSYGSHFGHVSYDGPQEWMFWGIGTGQYDLKPGISMKSPGGGGFRTLIEQGVADVSPIGDNGQGKILAWASHNAPNGQVVLIDPAAPDPKNWQTVIHEGSDPLKHVFVHDGKLCAVYSRDCADSLSVFSKTGEHLADAPLPPARLVFAHASMGGVAMGADLPPGSGELFFQATTFTDAPQVMAYDLKSNSVRPLDPAPPQLSLGNDCIVETLWARSKDGTQVPMTVIRRQDVQLDGSAALKMEGYGGYGCSQGPHCDTEMADFIKSGGIYVQTYVRGGGELGTPWHEGGRLANKENCFDDFNACGQHLVDLKYTSAGRIVAEGHSHGGMLVLGAMQRAPQLYGAIIAGCPVTDTLMQDGQRQDSEFGNPYNSAAERDTNLKISPLYNISSGEKYPPVLLRSAENDFLLGHSLKFAAAMHEQNPQSTCLLHVEKGFGHASSRPPDVEASESAQKKTFIEKTIGPIDQSEWKIQYTLGSRPALATVNNAHT